MKQMTSISKTPLALEVSFAWVWSTLILLRTYMAMVAPPQPPMVAMHFVCAIMSKHLPDSKSGGSLGAETAIPAIPRTRTKVPKI